MEVASFTDAWIETDPPNANVPITLSHLLQMRGLKPKCFVTILIIRSRIFYRCVD